MPTLEHYESEREAEEESRGRQLGSRTGAMALGGPVGGSRSQHRVATFGPEHYWRYVNNVRQRTDHELSLRSSQMSTDDLPMTSGATHPERDSPTYVSDPQQPLNQPPRLIQRRSHPDPSSLNDDFQLEGQGAPVSVTITNDYGLPSVPRDQFTSHDDEDESDLDSTHGLAAAPPSATLINQHRQHNNRRALLPLVVYSPSRTRSTVRQPPYASNVTMQSSQDPQVNNQAGHESSSADPRS